MESTTPKVLSPEELLGRPLNDIEQKHAPRQLYVACGREIPISGPRTAIVGSRKATPEGIKDAAEIATFLAKNRVVIVSGLAEGIDTSAHNAALREGGSTIAVLGTSLDKFYPSKNSETVPEPLEDIVRRYCCCQFAVSIIGSFIVTDVELL